MKLTATLTALFLAISVTVLSSATRLNPSVNPLTDDNGRNFCSTWSINQEKHYYVTAAHCVKGDEGEMPIPHIKGVVVSPVFIDVVQDIAVVVGEFGSPALKIANNMPQVGDKVTIVGYPLGLDQQVGQAVVQVLHQKVKGEANKTIFSGFGVAPGSSGSAVLNKSGQVISDLQLGWPIGGIYGGIPWEV